MIKSWFDYKVLLCSSFLLVQWFVNCIGATTPSASVHVATLAENDGTGIYREIDLETPIERNLQLNDNVVYRINCGSNVNVVDKYNRTWTNDQDLLFVSDGSYSICSTAIGNSIVNTELDNIYCSERYFQTSGGYSIRVNAGTYRVQMLFAEIFYDKPGIRVFNISLQDTLVAINLDLAKNPGYLTARSITRLVTVTTPSPVVRGGIRISFEASKDNPKINGIIITRVGDVVTPVAAPVPTRSPVIVPVLPPSTVLRVPIRINAGVEGNSTYVDSKGRAWGVDKYFDSGATYSFADNCPGMASDPKLYCTERYAVTGKLNYKIPVRGRARYTVNLHFAEFIHSQRNKRIFNVTVQGNTVASLLDLYAKVGYRKPYILSVPDIFVRLTQPYISIDLLSVKDNAKISGIEIVRYVPPRTIAPVTPTKTPVRPTNKPVTTIKLVPPIRINTGANTSWVDPISKDVWEFDKYFTGGTRYGTTICSNSIDGTQTDALACSERYFIGGPNVVSGKYTIPVQAGTYTLKLFFAETLYGPGVRVFSVKVQGSIIISQLDIAALVGMNNAFTLTRTVTVRSNDAGLLIEFVNLKENAKINAIAVLQ